MSYDSTADTLLHIKRVNELLIRCAMLLLEKGIDHDESKLSEPEKSGYDTVTMKLKGLTYGSDEYKASLAELQPILKHHYENNGHHPEHYDNGINGMDLFDIFEMLMDWKAAGERHADGDILKSIEINTMRFNISDQLASVLKNTIETIGW